MRAHTAMSAEAATHSRTAELRLWAAAYSLAMAMTRMATMKGSRSWVATAMIREAVLPAAVVTQTTAAKWRFHARTKDATTNAARTEAAIAAGKTLNRRVSSHNMGTRIRTDVAAYAMLANRASVFTLVAAASHMA